MATMGDTFIDSEAPSTLEAVLERIHDVARTAVLTIEALCRRDREDAEEADPDPVLLQNMVWPIELLAFHAREMERVARLGAGSVA